MSELGTSGALAALVPVEVTSFVGRRFERSQVRNLLADSRLVTLTGFGGVGKTRLAVRVAHDLRRAFTDGVFFIPLATVSDPEWLPEYLLQTLGLQGRSQRTAVASTAEYLASRHLLLVMDNCEHVIDSVAALIDDILRGSSRVHVLATSREPLRIDGEAVHSVSPLSVPSAGDDPSGDQSEGVVLFVDRAKAAAPGFALTPENRRSVAAICRQLEGIPLAIELAASRLRAMSPMELDQRLTDHWELLSHGSRAAPERQRTMAACIEWSLSLCSEAERDLLATASVFADGFELDALTSVCIGTGDESALADTILALVDKSLVIASAQDCTRFRILPPIRQRGLQLLGEQARLTDARRRHRDWCAELVRQSSVEWVSPRQLEWMHRLRREAGNIRAALEFSASEPGEAEPGLIMGGNMIQFAIAEGLFRQNRKWFEDLLDKAPDATIGRAMAIRASCWWAALQGDVARAAELLDESRRLAEALGGHVRALHSQTEALVTSFSGEYRAGAALFEHAIEELRAEGDLAQVAASLCLLGLTCTFMGDIDGAVAAHHDCVALTEAAGEHWYRAYSYFIAGVAAWAGGDPDAAGELQRESLRLRRLMNDPLGVGFSLEAMAWLLADTDPHLAAVLLGAAKRQWEMSDSSAEAFPGLSTYHEEFAEKMQNTLIPEALDEAISEGRALSNEEAIGLALGERPAARAAGPAPSLTSSRMPLTRRELEVAELVCKGLSNKDIADTLVISKRTAETHVEHILTKLGFTNRGQIGAWLTLNSPQDD